MNTNLAVSRNEPVFLTLISKKDIYLIDLFLENLRKQNKSEETYKAYSEDLKRFIEWLVLVKEKSLNEVTASLSAVGLGDVPAWLRPFKALSNGEQYRAGLARLICDAPDKVVIDEFTSVVDRQIAQIGASAFAKSWRRTKGKQIVLLSCHYDIVEWLQPDWVYDTRTGEVKKKSKNDHLSSSTFGRQTELTGSILKSIII